MANHHPDAKTVKQLIASLKRMPENLSVYHQDTVHPNDPAVPVHRVARVPGDGEEEDWVIIQ